MLDFGLLPPEVNSALMYAGPGSGPMLVAAAGWQALAADLLTTASAYQSVVTGLMDGPWLGAAALSMAGAATPQIAWLNGAAGQAEHAAAQAAAAASAYEAAFAATVPPPVIAANRVLLMELLATNFLGQNTPAIAATEAQYLEMWSQDAAAMYGYAGASAAASALPPFDPAGPATNPAGVAAQEVAVAQAVASSAAADTQELSALTDAMPGTLAGLAGPPPAANPFANLFSGGTLEMDGMAGAFLETLTGSSTLHAGTPIDMFKEWVGPSRLFVTIFKDLEGLSHSMAPKAAAQAVEGAAKAAGSALPAALSSTGAGGAAGAVVGEAVTVGALSVPQAWAGVAPAATPAVATLNGLAASSAVEPATNAVGGMPLVGSGLGRGMSANFAIPRYGFKPTVITHPPAGG
ncbi:PPE family protein [Mycobacterium sp. SMC-2]|uniref:PPE family protein n=1 Tax=Mycobacterium sp. SMC-2 TaxID=2857058 RepID=UPI0021B2CEA3|nr:PPE family protein [Mycobacterium sp. SMC-2]UXA06840.1 PPE family protein [Mycobacterium sp. SMC-2]